MIAVDTNVLVYAHRSDSQHHVRAVDAMRLLAEGTASWAIPWPCLHEFLAIATHPRIFDPPTKMVRALEQVDAWLGSPAVTVIGEGVDHWTRLQELVVRANVRGPMVHDARIAAICIAAGVTELLTSDRDFSRFSALRARNPFD
jgi:toxin-antitoxin system PIN domain toxin